MVNFLYDLDKTINCITFYYKERVKSDVISNGTCKIPGLQLCQHISHYPTLQALLVWNTIKFV